MVNIVGVSTLKHRFIDKMLLLNLGSTQKLMTGVIKKEPWLTPKNVRKLEIIK